MNGDIFGTEAPLGNAPTQISTNNLMIEYGIVGKGIHDDPARPAQLVAVEVVRSAGIEQNGMPSSLEEALGSGIAGFGSVFGYAGHVSGIECKTMCVSGVGEEILQTEKIHV